MSDTDHTSDPMGREYSDPGEYVEVLAYAIWVGAKSATTDDPEHAWEALSDEERDLFAVVVSDAVSPLMSDLRIAEARATAAEVASRGYRERAEKAEAKAARFAGLLGHQSRTLTDAIAAETIRQKADALS